MMQYENIQKALGMDIAISGRMSNAIQRWGNLYMNRAPWLRDGVRSLNLPAAICTETARLVTMESEVSVTGSRRAEMIAGCLKPFLEKLPVYVEYACSTGGILFKPYVSGGRVFIDVVKTGYFYPVEFDGSGAITGAVFTEFKRKGKKLYTRLEYQQLTGGRYFVVNKAFVSRRAQVRNDDIINIGQEIPLADVPEWADIEPYVEFDNADRTLFSYFRIPVANNIDPESPLGVSVYARAEEQIKDADEQYGAAMWEFRSKETAVQAAREFFKKDRQGNAVLPKGKERLYHDMGANISDIDGRPFFNVYSPEIRDISFFNGYNRIIQKVEFNSGLAYGTLSDPQTVDKTAEEIKVSKQRSYATVKSIQNSLENALRDLAGAIDAWMTIEGLAPPGEVDVSVSWDDSLVTDKETERKQDRQDVAMGAMQMWEYRAKWYNEDETAAKAAVGSAQKGYGV